MSPAVAAPQPTALVTVLIPTYNETARLALSAAHWRDAGLLQSCPCVITDDGSTDGTPDLAERLLGELQPVRILRNPRHRSKLSAILSGLGTVDTRFVLCLDADTWFAGDPRELLDECGRLATRGVDAAAFRLVPTGESSSLVVTLQACEYALTTDVMRRVFGVVGNVNGAASLWRTSVLRAVLAQHSLVFEGDDLEATIIAHQMGARVEASQLSLHKLAKPTLAALARQRVAIWDAGLFDVVRRRPPLHLAAGTEAVFFQWYALFEGVLHPAKVLSFAVLVSCVIGVGLGIWLDWLGHALTAVYALAAVSGGALWLRARHGGNRRYRALGLLVFLFCYPAAHLWLTFSRWGVLIYFSSWILLAALQAVAIRDHALRRRALRISPLLPAYFLMLTLCFRTAGLCCWLWRRLRCRFVAELAPHET